MPSIAVTNERDGALIDAKSVVDEYGDEIKLILRNEGNVTRGKYGGIKRKTTTTEYTFNAYPIIYNPGIYALEKAGLRQEVNVVIYLAVKDFIDNSLDFDDIGIIRSTVQMKNGAYEIKEKAQVSQFADVFLYYTLGLFKR